MAKGKMTARPPRMGARRGPGFNARPSQKLETWKWKFYIRPSSDEANEKIARILSRFGNIEEYERSEKLPGYTEKQGAYMVPKFIMDDVDKNQSVRNQYEAFVQKTKDGKFYRHRTPEQIQDAKDQMVRNLVERAKRKEAKSP